MRFVFCSLHFFLVFISTGLAQIAPEKITVYGHAYNAVNPYERLDDLMIINLTTSQGVFGKADGTFEVTCLKRDTILVASTGYEFKRVCFADSQALTGTRFQIPLVKLNVTLRDVFIFSPRDLQAIYSDIEKLGYNKKDFQLSGVDAFQSPITFLYQEFSKKEQLKRHNAERINAERGRDLLKQLLSNYISYDIINLDSYEFDDFIDYCQVPESFMKSASQYDFCIYIKRKFELYRMTRSNGKW